MHPKACHREDHPRIGRRELLQVGALGLLGAGMSDVLRLEADAADVRTSGHAKSVIFIFQSGGPSQHETWDPKPDAPAEIRGEYGTTATRLAGVRFCEYLPRLAARSDKFSIGGQRWPPKKTPARFRPSKHWTNANCKSPA